MTKRHEYITELRQTVSDCVAKCERMRLHLPCYLAQVIASSVVYSREIVFVFDELYTKFFQPEDVEEWRQAVRSVFEQHRARINSPKELQSYIVVYFVNTLEADRSRYFQAEIDDHLESLNLVAKAYMSKPERQLLLQGKVECKEVYAPVQYVTTEQDL